MLQPSRRTSSLHTTVVLVSSAASSSITHLLLLTSLTYLAGNRRSGLGRRVSRLVYYVDSVDDHISILNNLLILRRNTHRLRTT